ncbi:hypothetical protein RKD18_001566 [Streptomyces phaeoluteigriseus]
MVPGAAAAFRLQIAQPRQQVDAGRLRVLDQMRRHLTVEQRGDMTGPLHGQVQETVPLCVRQDVEQHVGPVSGAVTVLDDSRDPPGPHRHRAHRSRAREPAARP